MDKLQPQTVYVADSFGDHKINRPDETVDGVTCSSWFVAKQLPGVYPLTGKELIDLIAEWDYRVHTTIKDYLQSNGVVI